MTTATGGEWSLSEMLTNPASQAQKPNSAVPHPHVLLLDTGAVLRFIDVLSDPNLFTRVIIAQSVWNRVKSANQATYKRLAELYQDNRDRFYVYMNEFSCHTHLNAEKEGTKEN